MLIETCEYLFETYEDLQHVKVTISSGNEISKRTFKSAGGYQLSRDYYQIDRPTKKRFGRSL